MSEDVTAELEAKENQRRLSKEELLSPHPQTREVPIEELGGSVVIKSLNVKERRELRKKGKVGEEDFDADEFDLLSIVACVVEPKLTYEDVEALREQDSTIVDQLAHEVNNINLVGRGLDLKKLLSQIQNSDSNLNLQKG